MNTGIIASRYADALLKYVEETGDGQVVYRQACALADALSASGEFERLVESKTLLKHVRYFTWFDIILTHTSICYFVQ